MCRRQEQVEVGLGPLDEVARDHGHVVGHLERGQRRAGGLGMAAGGDGRRRTHGMDMRQQVDGAGQRPRAGRVPGEGVMVSDL